MVISVLLFIVFFVKGVLFLLGFWLFGIYLVLLVVSGIFFVLVLMKVGVYVLVCVFIIVFL